MPQRLNHRFTSWLHRNLTYPTIVRLRGEGAVFSRLREFESAQWMTPDELTRRQGRRLVDLLEFARTRSPFHAQALSNLGPLDASTVHEQIRSLPRITKKDVQSRYQQMIARPRPRRVTRKVTGGSTGQPVTVVKDRAAIAAEMAASWMGYGWFGITPGDRAVRFWGSPATMKRRLRFAAADFAMNRIRFSAFAFDDNDLERYWQRCLRFRPAFFYGYVSMLEAFAAFVRRRGYPGHELSLKAIITTAEVLTDPQRALLETTFGTAVQNEYGCGEVGPIAYQCERGQLHLMSDNLFVEILRPDGTPAGGGDTGDIVITDLNNRAMPLIRYGVGDLGVPGEPCKCRRGLPVLSKVWGREYDFVQAPDGRQYHGEFFMYLFEDLRGSGIEIEQFQLVQRDASTLDVSLLSARPISEAWETAVRSTFAERLPHMSITIRAVAAIERASSGKVRVIQNAWSGARG